MTRAAVIGLDAESNGLHGRAFAAAAIEVDGAGEVVREFAARCPIEGPVDEWVTGNVLPKLRGLEETHQTYETMGDDLYLWLADRPDGAWVVAHVVWPVETRLLSDVYSRPGREFGGPFPLLDTAVLMAARGEPEPTSDTAYLERHGMWVPGAEHDPRRDALVAARIWLHLTGPRRVRRELGRMQRHRDLAKSRW